MVAGTASPGWSWLLVGRGSRWAAASPSPPVPPVDAPLSIEGRWAAAVRHVAARPVRGPPARAAPSLVAWQLPIRPCAAGSPRAARSPSSSSRRGTTPARPRSGRPSASSSRSTRRSCRSPTGPAARPATGRRGSRPRSPRSTTLTPVAHLTCVGASRAELRQVVGAYAAAGVRNVLALRGDPPDGPGAPWTAHPRGPRPRRRPGPAAPRARDFEVGVAAFPDVHPESPDVDHDARVLAAKADAGATFAITQFFFEADGYFRLVDRVASARLRHPDHPRDHAGDERAADRAVRRSCRASRCRRGCSAASRRRPTTRPTCAGSGSRSRPSCRRRLLDGGAPGLHFYTLNRSTATLEVFADLGLVTRRAGAQ